VSIKGTAKQSPTRCLYQESANACRPSALIARVIMSTAIAAARAKTRGKRMLREALEGYGEDEFTLSEWNAKKKEAAEQGKWTWKQRLMDPNQAIKARIEKHGDVQDALKDRFVDISSAMQQEIHEASRGPGAPQQNDTRAPDCCEWRYE